MRRSNLHSCLLLAGVLVAYAIPLAAQPDDHDDLGPVQTGYAVITPITTPVGMTVSESFALKRNGGIVQAGILPMRMTTEAALFVTFSRRLSRDTGLAIANPGATEARITLTLRRDDGSLTATETILVRARRQTAVFISEIFSGAVGAASDFSGTVELVSTVPVGLTGLRFRGQEFTGFSLANLSSNAPPVPTLAPGVGGIGAVLLPHVVSGGGWATEIVIGNNRAPFLVIRVDFFRSDGSPMTITLNGTTASTFFNLTVPSGGVVVLAPRDSNGDSRF